ncbi:MAG: T9SS type A sorting domain-containing protein [Bacteroidia bacterium]|nr:T9SS type A sorting domain-containing protein [Bacteroidia bacterium]
MKRIQILLLALLFSVSGMYAQRVCGSMEHLSNALQNDPTLADRMAKIEEHTNEFIKNNPKGQRVVITIPVVVHVVYNTATQNVSNTQIQTQLDVLNADFRKLNADASLIPTAFQSVSADCEINFCLAQRDPAGNTTTGIQRRQTTVTAFSTNDAMKYYAQGGLDAWDRNQYLNIWVCNMSGGILGYAQFPGGAAATDGVVILYSAFGTTGTAAAPFNKGRTATHEVGHWLNLRHIWGDANCGSDLVADTPTHNTSNYGCPTYPHASTCSGNPTEMTMNYMDYTDDACMYMFTAGQKARMQAVLTSGGSRVSLATSNGCTPASGGGTCATPTGVSAGSVTNTGAVISWTAVSGATSYNVTVGANTYSTTATSYTLSGLTACTAYSASVQAVCGTSGSSASASTSFTTTGCTACSDNFESNNTKNSAKTISVNTNYTARIGTSTDVDWFKFTTTASAPKVKIELTNLPFDYDVKLYASNGSTQLGVSQNSGTTNETILYNTATAGSTYFIRVYGYNGAFSSTACYTFRASTSATSWVRQANEVEDGLKPVFDDLVVYPNPTNGLATLKFTVEAEDENALITIYDQTGKVMNVVQHDITKDSDELTLDFSQFANGIYFIQMQKGDMVTNAKIIVTK